MTALLLAATLLATAAAEALAVREQRRIGVALAGIFVLLLGASCGDEDCRWRCPAGLRPSDIMQACSKCVPCPAPGSAPDRTYSLWCSPKRADEARDGGFILAGDGGPQNQ